MRVGILGPLEVAADGVAVEVAGGRLRALLIRLALEPGRAVPVAALAEALWADETPGDPVGAVQQLVSRLRRALPDGGVLRSTPAGYLIELPADAVDAARFERLVAEGRRALRAGRAEEAGAALREALRLWRGPALADAADAPYAQGAAARLEELRLTAAEDRAEAELIAAGDATVPSGLIAELGELAAAHPLRERLHALRMRALITDGRVAEALTAYAELRERLAGTLGVDPSPEVQAIHLAALRGGPAASPATAAGTNLRAAVNSFVGREPERALLLKQLEEGRLVTLVGPGGAGKTRLATTVAQELHGGTGSGGVWLVELAPVAADEDVARAALGALQRLRVTSFGTSRLPGAVTSPEDRLVELLAPHDAVLVLDNCEHVVAGAARLAEELLGSCPGLRIIATSRERLGIGGEALCPVPPLDLPPQEGVSAAEALGWPSVRLFRDRAVAVRPGFAVDATTVDAVVEVCRRLDGMPLAIELAAARLRALPIQEVVRRLDDRFALLTGGSRTALPRHRTLRAVVAWSWDLLDEPERLLAERLSVFPGAFTQDDAEAVCGVPGDVLLSLVDRSLVQVASEAGPRYRMLDTIAVYASERLAASGDGPAIRLAHARHFLALAEEAEPHLRRAEQLEWLARLHGAHDDVLTALRFAADERNADLAVRLAAAMIGYWIFTGKQEEGTAWCELTAALPGPAPAQARALVRGGALLPQIGEGGRETALAAFGALLAERDETWQHPFLALAEAGVAFFADDMPEALAAVDRALTSDDVWLRATAHLFRSFVLENDGDPAGRRRELEIATGLLRELGERLGLAAALTELSEALAFSGEFEAALAVLDESITLLRTLNADDDVTHQRLVVALINVRRGEAASALDELKQLIEEGDLAGSLQAQSYAVVTLGATLAVLGDLDPAEAQLLRARELIVLNRSAPPQIEVLIDCGLAMIAVRRGDVTAAAAMIPGAVASALAVGDIPVLARTGCALASVRHAQGRAIEAAELLGAVEVIRGGPDLLSLDIAAVTETLIADLGAPVFEEAASRGRLLTREAAIALLPTP